MIRFSLPETSAEQPVAFRDAFLATQWLARQPQANVSTMLEALTDAIDAFNRFSLPAWERFRTLEALRKAVFTVGIESRRRFENKPLPLLPSEQAIVEATCRLWRCCTLGYLHCLNACLEGEAGVVDQAGKVVHRAITSLRMEQLCRYWASNELDEYFWRELHAIYLSAEILQVTNEPVGDLLPKETAESTVVGQYGMAILMHLADPFSLSHGQLLTVIQWISRWRELVTVQAQPDATPTNTYANTCCVVLDLSSPKEPASDSTTQRWVSFITVFHKIQKRIKALKAGTPPENLKLGKTTTPEVSLSLLEKLSILLRHPMFEPARAGTAETQPIEVLTTMEDVYRLIGGASLQESQPEESVARIKAERLAIFGHTADPRNLIPVAIETWLAGPPIGAILNLRRSTVQNGRRLIFGSLLGIRQTPEAELCLATIARLSTHSDQFMADVSLSTEKVSPLIMEVTEKISNAVLRYPALLLTGPEGLQAIVPTGLLARANRCRIYDGADSTLLKLVPQTLVERYGDNERWTLVNT